MIPRRLAFRAWYACASTEARAIRRMVADRGVRRAARRGGPGSAAELRAAREARADRLERLASALLVRLDDPRSPGADVAPELVGLICTLIHGDGPTIAALRRRAAGRLDGVSPDDTISWIKTLLEIR